MRNKNYQDDQEYKVQTSDDFLDDTIRTYDRTPKIKNEIEIIKDIKNGIDYRTNENTKVIIRTRKGVDFITTESNNIDDDNLMNLPEYE